MTITISTDLERLRTWLGEHDYHDRASNPNVFNDGRRERDDVVHCFAVELSANLRYFLAAARSSSDEKLRQISEAHADYERNCEAAKALFRAWMGKPAEQA